jgi:hypothetical protein
MTRWTLCRNPLNRRAGVGIRLWHPRRLLRRSQPLATGVHPLYDFNVPNHEVLSREDLVARTIDQHYRGECNIVDSSIAALKLREGMVLRISGTLRVVISVGYDKSNSAPVVLAETSSGFHKFTNKSRIDVWHIQGRPFIMTLPPEGFRRSYTSDDGGCTPPAHDAAGIVPVWRGPKRLN